MLHKSYRKTHKIRRQQLDIQLKYGNVEDNQEIQCKQKLLFVEENKPKPVSFRDINNHWSTKDITFEKYEQYYQKFNIISRRDTEKFINLVVESV